jgi:hypothetical protein
MISAKYLAILIFALFLAMPVKVCLPQQADPESSLFEDSSTTASKDKKKEKKNLEINEKFLISLGIDLFTVVLIISLIYYPNYHKRDYIFTFIMFNIVIFLLTFVLKYVKLSVGAAFGLFAVFSVLRYRTSGISMKDMTYLFTFIAMGVVSAIQLEYYELGVLHAIILTGTFILDGKIIFKPESYKTIRYEKIEMIKPENKELLIEDLRMRTGLNIHKFTIERINFLRDTATIKVFYYD